MDEAASSVQVWTELVGPASYAVGLDDPRVSALVELLNDRGEPEVVTWAVPLLTDRDSWRCAMAARVIAQHGYQRGRPYRSLVMPALVAAARIEQVDTTRAAMVDAIADTQDPSWVDELLRYAADPFSDVRRVVAANLPLIFAGEEMSDHAIRALIELSDDPDPHVRDSATAGLGSHTELDNDAIRTALRSRLDDNDDDDTDTSSEAALGLALRGDPNIHRYITRRLDRSPELVSGLIVQAAGALGDTRLLSQMWRLHERGWRRTADNPQALTDAIVALAQLS